MSLVELISRARDLYVEQFRAFRDRQAAATPGGAEIKLRLADESSVWRNLYCVDYLAAPPDGRAFELGAERVLSFDPLEGSLGGAALSVVALEWDAVRVTHDLAALPEAALDAWFAFWFDPDDARAPEPDGLNGSLHSLVAEPNALSVDFGTAAPDALWELLDLLEAAGARHLQVGSAHAES